MNRESHGSRHGIVSILFVILMLASVALAQDDDRRELSDERGRPSAEAEQQVNTALRRALDRSGYSVKKKDAGLLDVADASFGGFKVRRSDEEWRQLLTPAQFEVTRQRIDQPVAEVPQFEGVGVFSCTCGNHLFHSQAQTASSSGYVSFKESVTPTSVVTALDSEWTLGEGKVELMCSVCGAHLGHVDPGDTPADAIRFMVNPTALLFTAEAQK